MEQNAENNNNQITMHVSGYYNSTICAKTGTFCSQNRRICSREGHSAISSLTYLHTNQLP